MKDWPTLQHQGHSTDDGETVDIEEGSFEGSAEGC